MSELIEALGRGPHAQAPAVIALRQYVKNGKDFDFQKLVKREGDARRLFPLHAFEALPPWEAFDDEAKRFVRAVVTLGMGTELMRRVKPSSPEADESATMILLSAYGEDHAARLRVAEEGMIASGPPAVYQDGRLTPWGRFLLSLSDRELTAAAEQARDSTRALELLIDHAPQRVEALAPAFLYFHDGSKRYLSDRNCRLLLKFDAARYERLVAPAVALEPTVGRRFATARHLAEYFPGRYGASTRTLALETLDANRYETYEGDEQQAFTWLLNQSGPDVESALTRFIRRSLTGDAIDYLKLAVNQRGPDGAGPLLVAAAESSQPELAFYALESLVASESVDHDETIRRLFESGLNSESDYQVVRHVGLAGTWNLAAMAPELWKLLAHRSSWVRATVVEELAKLGDGVVGKAVELVAADTKQARAAAVALLGELDVPAAAEALEARIDAEPDEKIRRRIFSALDKSWQRQGRGPSRAEIDTWIERAAPNLADAVPDWLDETALPPVYYDDGERLPNAAVRYLFFRQLQYKPAAPEIEAKPLYALVDRRRSGEFALHVLERYLASGELFRNRRAMMVAALTGDDRIVEPLRRQIIKWSVDKRYRLALFAVQALARVGTDAALTTVCEMAARYSRRREAVGRAAATALHEAVGRRGRSPREVPDELVPRLGFEVEKPRVFAADDGRTEVRIGPDWRLRFRDAADGGESISPPAWVPAEMKAELDDLGAVLETLARWVRSDVDIRLSRRLRSSSAAWRATFRDHPLFVPFSVRMLWGCYDAAGRLSAVFRAEQDGSLVDVQGRAFDLPDDRADSGDGPSHGVTVGLVHPLELNAAERTGWAAHLTERGIKQPVRQLKRRVIRPTPEESGQVVSSLFEGTMLGAGTLRRRMGRLGWRPVRGKDSNTIPMIYKPFPNGVEAVIAVRHNFIDVNERSQIDLGSFFFTRGAATLSDDEWTAAKQPLFGEISPIVYSETLLDLYRISGEELPVEQAVELS